MISLSLSQVVPTSSFEISAGNVSSTCIEINIANSASTVDEYAVEWERDTSGVCPDVDKGNATINGSSINYTITGLEEDSSYNITVTATTAAGSNSSQIIVNTGEAGEH